MRIHQLCWARLCVAATATSFVFLAGHADAARTHKVVAGDNVDLLAKRYNVPVQDIVKANNITADTILKLGRTLTIPDPPKRIAVPGTMRKPARVKPETDRVTVRLGPGVEFNRVALFDSGAPFVVTATKEGWAQVELTDGRAGWVRQDLLDYAGNTANVKLASESKKPSKKQKRFASAPATPLESRRKSRKHAALASMKTSGHSRKKHHEEQRPERLASKRTHSKRYARHSKKGIRVARAVHGSRRGHYVPEASRPAAANDVVRTAYAYRGTPYRWGGASRGGFDCSGFTSYLYHRKGVSLPHSASGQFNMGKHVSRGEMKPGDLVFFHTVTRGISHVGMYVGNGKFVHSSSRRSGGVRVDSLDSGYYRERFRGARRMAK